MALSNRDRIGKMFELLAPPLDDYISSVIGAENKELGARWADLVAASDGRDGTSRHDYDPQDPQVQLRMLTEGRVTSGYRKGWYPFRDTLGRAGDTYASEMRETRNQWAHNKPFTNDDAYRALDTCERLLTLVGAPQAAEQVKALRLDLRRLTAEQADRKVLRQAADSPEGTGLRPWREVLLPHDDVATGNFHASEFAADLYKVATGGEGDADYAQPVEFFARTYLTEGLKDLVERAVRRTNGDSNASPVINLQTNFGGGKTHSMLSLWHLAAGLPLTDYPQDTQELLARAGYTGKRINRVAIVGNHLSTVGSVKPDGTRVNTIWGELAWQVGGAEAFAIVAQADANRTPPGDALHTLLAAYSPAVILIDEWVAYARSLVGRDDLAGGTFDDQFTFAQSLTEAVKGTPGVLLAISIPASESGDDSQIVAGNAEEVGGTHGMEALRRLQNVVRRVADQWRPASSNEAYDIVRQRLFQPASAQALADIGATAQAFSDMYRRYSDEFPREATTPQYEARIRRTYPIHPELFDTLYEEWSTLERFQRTRGVLRLMSTVIHALWQGQDASPLIMPGSVPLATANVNTELTQYLQDSWKPIIDADVDGPNAEPAKIDEEKPIFGRRAVTRRLARTVFFGGAPTVGPHASSKGIVTQRVFLGTAIPGDNPRDFHSAVNLLQDRAAHFYSASGRYWYDLQTNITRTARDQADRLHPEDVWAEIRSRLAAQARTRGAFAGVLVCPESNADIPDTDEVRLVILHPRVAHKRGTQSEAREFARLAVTQHGTAGRTNRNTLVFLAADRDRMEELDNATRDYLGWKHVLSHEADLDLTANQRAQADSRLKQADSTLESRLLNTFHWGLVPSQPDPRGELVIDEVKIEGSNPSLAERVTRKLGSSGELYTQVTAPTIRMALDRVPAIWERGHVRVGDLWALYAQYPYMHRFTHRRVLEAGLVDEPMLWQKDGFALAAGYDEAAQRYIGLWIPHTKRTTPAVTDATLVVKPELAEAQRRAEEEEKSSTDPDTSSTDGVQPTVPRLDGDDNPAPSPAPVPQPKIRYFGSTTLRADRIGLDFRNVSEEVIRHLQEHPGAKLTLRLEIEAEDPAGFTEQQMRTVRENATTLKFEQSGFEES